MILHKTELAITELSASKRSLSLMERRILLFVDGVRNIDQIRELVNHPNAGENIYLLEKNGYLSKNRSTQLAPDEPVISAVDELMVQIRPLISNRFLSKFITATSNSNSNNIVSIKAESIHTALVSVTPPPEKLPVEELVSIQDHLLDEQTKLAIKRIIAETSAKHLGIFSRELLDKTQHAQDAKELRTCISRWHMAMQESKTGRAYCFDFLNEVNELFKHGTESELKIA